MKIELKKVDATRRQMLIEIPKETVSKRTEQVFNEISKIAKIKGFRTGKIPRNILEKHYSDSAKEEVLKQLIPEAYQEGLDREKLFPVDMPEIDDVSLKDGIVKFSANFDVRPDVTIKDYVGIKIKRKSSEVTDDEIEKTLDYFKKGQGKEDAKIDDEFAKGLGYPSLDEFKTFLKRQMEMDKDRLNRADVENQVIESLIKKTKFTVPKSLVTKQLERRMHETKHQMKHQGYKDEDIKKQEETMEKEMLPLVERDIKAYFILEKIAETENMEIKQGENLPVKVMEFLLKEAKWEETK